MARIVLTGGASGLGAAITRHLAASGEHTLCISYCRAAEQATLLMARHANVTAHALDFREPASIEAFGQVLDEFRPDVLIHNAVGGLRLVHAHKLEREAWMAGFMTNVLPVIELTNIALKGFRRRKSGRIITILTDGLVGAPPLGMAEYVATKAYLASLSRSWAVENASHGITSNCVLPALMDTGLLAGIDERLRAQMIESLPNQRALEVDEAAQVVAFLVTCPPSVNGARFVVNGGRQME
jgi:3-oxoacyl-[acyl-carrier protein] reductase